MKVYTPYCLDSPAISCEGDVQISYFKYFLHPITYFRNFGSKASCNPSPNTLKANIVSEMKNAGKNNVHQFPERMAPNESFAITPQLAFGEEIPSPIKLRNASAKMADGTVKVICTMIGPIEFGSSPLRIIREVFVPNAFDARIYS